MTVQVKLRDEIAEHPWKLVAFGALAGLWFASVVPTRHKSAGIVRGLLGGMALRLVRSAAMFEMTRIAKSVIEVEDRSDDEPRNGSRKHRHAPAA